MYWQQNSLLLFLLNLPKGDKGVVLCWMKSRQTCITETGNLEAFFCASVKPFT